MATHRTADLDSAILQSLRGTSGPLLELVKGLSYVGEAPVVLALSVALAIARAIAGHLRTSLITIVTVAAATIASSILKLVVDRARPDALLALVREDGASFPSGHAALSATLCGIVAVLIGRTTLPLRLRIGIFGAMAMLVVLVGASRVYLGVHYPTDVVAGWLIAVAAVAAFRSLS